MAGNVMEYSLRFTADTAQAKANIRELQQNLNQLISQGVSSRGLGLDEDLHKANQTLLQLKANLKTATDSKTGLIDLHKFQANMNSAGQSLESYRTKLASLGPQGQQAFAQLAQGIAQANVPLASASTLLTKFATTLANTVRWQLSASMIRGFTSGISEAMRYAQDLNKSLTNIRIVTDYSTKDMAKFAVEANKAAKALSMTTTAYTDASLIFYQQGLRGEDVAQRTEVVSKMAAVTGQTAQIVSDQMTAVWNNFYDGSKSLEYYADAMTKLGAATASSTDEIADGLEKFAAVADTVGLSYETATAALATVTAETRQSASVVGTAFKTILARMEGLKLGETLEDGVELNKYSEALAAIGVSIFDQNNELKKMDQILDETGEKWVTLSRDQQVALSQTVAGVRQYSQFMSMMDNWDKIEKNISLAANSTGELNEQFSDYEESWEASANRVKAAWEEIIGILVDEDFFIGFNNGLAEALEYVAKLIEAFNGLPGILTLIGTLMLKSFGPQMAASINATFSNIYKRSDAGKKEAMDTKNTAISELSKMYQNLGGANAGGIVETTKGYKAQGKIMETLINKNDQLSEVDRERLRLQQEYLDKKIQEANLLEEEYNETSGSLHKQALKFNSMMENQEEKLKIGDQEGTVLKFKDDYIQTAQKKGILTNLKAGTNISNMENIKGVLGNTGIVNENGIVDQQKLEKAIEEVNKELAEKRQNLKQVAAAARELNVDENQLNTIIDNIGISAEQTGESIGRAEIASKNLGIVVEETDQIVDKFNNKKISPSFGDGIMAATQTIMGLMSALQSLKGVIDIWNDEDATLGEKWSTTIMSVTSAVMMLTMAFNANNLEQLKGIKTGVIQLGQWIKKTGAIAAATLAESSNTIVKNIGTKAQENQNRSLMTNIALMAIKHWWVTLIIAAVALLVVGIIAFANAESETEKELRLANEELERQKENLEAVRKEADELKTAFDGYKDIEKKLKGLTKGSDEWKDAVHEINQEVLDLLEKYPQLSKMEGAIGRTADGYLSINPTAIRKIQEEAQEKVINASLNKLQAEARVLTAEHNRDLQEINNGNIAFNYQAKADKENIDKLKQTAGVGQQAINMAEANTTKHVEFSGEFLETLGDKTKEEILDYFDQVEKSQKYMLSEEEQQLQNILTSDGAVREDIAQKFYDGAQKITDLNTEFDNNTEALKENTRALLGEKFSEDFINKYGEALVMGAYQDKQKTVQEQIISGEGGYMDVKDATLTNKGTDILEQMGYSNIKDAKIVQENGKNIIKFKGSENGSAEVKNNMQVELEDFIQVSHASQFTEQALGKDIENSNSTQKDKWEQNSGIFSDEGRIWDEKSDYYGVKESTANELEDKIYSLRFGASGNIEDIIGDDSLTTGAKNILAEKLNQKEKKELQKSGLDSKGLNELVGESIEEDTIDSLQITREEYNKLVKEAEKLNPAIKGNKKATAEYLKEQTQLNTKLNESKKVFDENKESLEKIGASFKTSGKNAQDFIDSLPESDQNTINQISDSLSNLFETDFDSADVIENLDLIQKAAEGDQKAINELVSTMEDDYQMDLAVSLSGDQETQQQIFNLMNSIDDMIPPGGFKVGVAIDPQANADFYTRCNELIKEAKLTQEQASEYFSKMGYDVKFKESTVWEPVYTYTWKNERDEEGRIVASEGPIRKIARWEQVKVSPPAVEVITPNGKGFGGGIQTALAPSTTRNTGNTTGGNTGGSKGGGSTPKSSEPKKFEKTLDDYVERYHEITLAIDDQTRALSKLTEMKDKAYGKSRLYWIKEEIEATKDYIDLLKRQRIEINSNLDLDKTAAEAVGFIFDENGNVNNYDEIMSNLYTNTKNAYSGQHEEGYTFSSDAEKEAYEKDLQDRIEAAEKKEEDTKKALQKYEETYSKFKELEQQILEEMIKQADLEVEGVTTKFELEIETFDKSIELFGAYAEAFGESASDLAFVFKNYQNEEKNKQIHSSQSEIASLANERQYNANILMNQYGVKFKEDGSIDETTIPEKANWARFKYESYASDYDEKILEFIPNMLENMVQLAKDNSLGYWEKALNNNEYNQNWLELLNNEAFGKEYIKNLNKIIGINDQNIKTLNDRIIGNQNAAKGAGASLNALLDSLDLTNYKIDSENMENLSAIDLQNITEEIKTRIDKANETQDFILANSLQNTLAEIIGHSGQISQYIDQVNEDTTAVLEKEQKNRTDKLERITNTVEYIIESEKRQIELLEWQQEWLQRNPYQQANQAINLQEQAILQRKNYDTAKAGFDAIVAGYQAENRGPTAKEKAQMESFYDTMKESTQNVLTIQDSFLELVPSVLEEISGVFDKFTSQLEGITGKLSSMENILGLLGIEDSGLNQSIRDAQFELGNAGVDNAAKKFETLKNNYLEIERDYQKALKQGDEASQKILKDQLDNAKTMIVEAENDMWTKISELITQVTEDFKKHIEDMMRISNEELDKMSDKFSKNSELQKQYLTDTQKVYELSKLSRQLEQDISNMDDINSKMALKEILEEINALQADSNKMSKFDLDVLKAEYEVEKARIALEDAQQAKNTMRLVRNANGGYSYAYTANQTEIDKAQQTYEDKIYNLQKLMEDYLEELGKARIEIQKGLNDELAKLNPNDFETQKEFEAEVQRIIDYWSEKFNYNTDEMSKVMKMLGIDYKETSYGMIANNSSLEEDVRQFSSNIKFYTQEASTAWETWSERTNIAIDDVADSTEDLAENVKDYTEDISDYIIDLQEETEEPLEKLNNQLSLLSDKVASWFTNSDFAKGLNTMYNGLNDIADIINKIDTNSLPNLPDVNYDTKRKLVNEIVWLKKEWTKGNNTGNEDLKNWAAETAKSYYNELEILDSELAKKLYNANYDEAKIIKEEFDKFDTGGYTGEWGSEGRIAMLHQKELVLNASDTQNILDAVQLVRSIGEDLVASALPKEFLTNFVRTAGNTIGKSEEIFQQDIQINANFPNVSSREEIEQAFNSLAQRAVQYANRKNL